MQSTGQPDEKSIFLEALQKSSATERALFLDVACGGNPQLRGEIDALLKAHDWSGDLLDNPVAPPFVPTISEPRSLMENGTVIGPYKLLQQIGEGGMGTVYMAGQTEPVQRKVALKLIKPGMDSRQVIARFEAERQALALMDHPHIAKVLDAGTTDSGLPYFVMELVKGVPLTKYCDEQHLTPRARLELFIPVCQAVQHAHQKGIIHRDLKPSNVLVALYDGRPVPKVIDFGVAKATGQKLTERTMYTEFGAIVGTLEYMSPEQAELNQLDVDTRSDIYSLGVLLYELLTGTTPFEKKRLKDAALMDVLRIIREDEPPKPSTRLFTTDELPSISANRGLEPKKLSDQVRGELDWIVMKALEKDRSRRYETANGMALDIQRYLNNEPVSACPPSTTYKFRKFLRRNRMPVLVVALLVLIAFGATATALRLSATREQSEGHRRRAEDAGEVAASQRQRADTAELQRTEQLWLSLRDQAKAVVLSGRPGQRLQGLEAIRQASAIRPSLDLRNAAITCMTLPDLATNDITWAATPEVLAQGWQTLAAGTDGLDAREVQPGVLAVTECVSGREVGRITGCLTPTRAWFSPNGKYTVLQGAPITDGSTDTPLEIWDWRLEKRILQSTGDLRHGLAFRSDNGQCVIGRASGDLVFFNLPDGTEQHHVRLALSSGHSPRGCIYSPDGGHVVTFLPYTQSIQFVAARSRQGVDRAVATPAGIVWIAISPDGRFLAVACNNRRAYIWDFEIGKFIRELVGHQAEVAWVYFVPGTAALVTWSWDGSVRYWDLPTCQSLLRLPIGPNPKLDNDSGRWVSDINSVLQVRSLTTSREFRTLLGHTREKGPTHVSFHPQGRLLATSCLDGVRLWDVDAGIEIGLLPGRFVTAHFTPDGRKLLACGAAGVFCWPVQLDAAGQSMRIGPAIQLARESDERRSSLTSDGAWLAATDRTNNTVELYEISTLSRSRVFSGIERIAFARLSPDGRWCVGGTWPEHQLAIWDSRTGELVQRMEVDGPPNASFNPAGTRLIVNGRNHGWVYSVPGWNLETEIARHPAGGFGVPCHSPDGRILAMTRNGYLIQLLDATTYEELATLELTQPLSTGELAFSPDGTRLAGASGANATMLWDLRLIRETLEAMNLDWAHPSFPPAQLLHEVVPQIVIDHAGVPQPAGESSKKVD